MGAMFVTPSRQRDLNDTVHSMPERRMRTDLYRFRFGDIPHNSADVADVQGERRASQTSLHSAVLLARVG
jgi:hypothetical protein